MSRASALGSPSLDPKKTPVSTSALLVLVNSFAVLEQRRLTPWSTGLATACHAWAPFHSGPSASCRCVPVAANVSTEENQFIWPMLIQTAFSFSSVVQRWVFRFSELRLVALRWFVAFLASGPCVASASSYFFRSAVPPRWRCAFPQFVPVAKSKLPVLASGSNISVKPTRILRSAYPAR